MPNLSDQGIEILFTRPKDTMSNFDNLFSNRERTVITWVLIVLLLLLAGIGPYQEFVLRRPSAMSGGPVVIVLWSIGSLAAAWCLFRIERKHRRESNMGMNLLPDDDR